MELRNNIYVCSLTHWDREWRFPYEKTRMLLVDMMDGLLDLLDDNPDYPCFHLDGQTILLEDYCEARPQNAQRIADHVRDGRLLIGPWLVLPEENQMSGESLVRNFLWGERIGRRFGGTMKIGYTPTSWGQVSQMPQIMRGVGLDTIIFYRGINADQSPGHYYTWRGPDGSELLGIRLGDWARVAFFHFVDRPVAFNRRRGEEFHEWHDGGKPFRMCGSGSATGYEFYRPPLGWYPEQIEPAFRELEEAELGTWETPHALALECDDCTGPFTLTPDIIAEARKRITNDKQIIYGDLPGFVALAKEHLGNRELVVLEGEMRHPERRGVFTDIYAEIQACRLPTKYANRRAEFAVQRTAEPLATIAWTLGEAYPTFTLDRANYLLLQNHAHDSIGGCGRDQVDEDVRYRFGQVRILSRAVTENAARQIAGHVDSGRFDANDILLVVFNPSPRPRSQAVRAEIDIARDRNVRGFTVRDLDGGEVPVQIISRRDCQAVFNHPLELPRRMDSDRWEFDVWAGDLPAMGYKVLHIEVAEEEMRHPGTMCTGPTSMANQHLDVHVQPNGTVDITCRETGQALWGLNLFEDRGEVGDYWVGSFPRRDRIINSAGSAAQITVIEDGALSAAIEVRLALDLPVRARQDTSAREAECRAVPITTVYRLVHGERFLRVRTTITNTVEDHILRARFPTDVTTDTACVETAFDVLERPIPLPDTRDWREPYKPVQPQQNFVDLSDGRHGVALLNRGLPQYEAVDDPRRTVALTLLRAHRAWNSVRVAYYPDQAGTQLQGTYTFDYAILPHAGDWRSGGVSREAERFNLDPVVGAAGPGDGDLPMAKSFLELEGDGLVLSTLKKGEWDDALIVRIFNPTPASVDGRVVLGFECAEAAAVNLLETEVEQSLPIRNNAIDVGVPPKKIVTLRLTI